MHCTRLLANQPDKEWVFYGRRAGRKLNSARKEALDSLLPRLAIPEDQLTKDGNLNPASLFVDKPEKIIFEIGFGNGERLAAHIKQNPLNGYIGAEPFINGVSAFLCEIKEQGTIDNIRVRSDDAIPIARSLKSESIDEIYVLNPDPWHKTRHHKRRIINQENLDHFARILRPEGKLIMTTDVEPLAEWMVTESLRHPAFQWTASKADDWRKPPKNWISTRYETKRAKGAGKMNYLFFKKVEGVNNG